MPGSTEEDFYRKNAFPLYDLYGHTLAQEPFPRGSESYNFGRLFLGHHYYIISLSNICMGVKKKNFKKNNAFSLYDMRTYMAKS